MIVRAKTIAGLIRTSPVVRFWDLASTKPLARNRDPDWTAGCLLLVADGEWFVLDVRRDRRTPKGVVDFLWDTHLLDDEWLERRVPVRVEQEGGSQGAISMDLLKRGMFLGVDFDARQPRGSKPERVKPMAIAAEAGHVHLVEGPWNETFLSELELLPDGPHDDQGDAFSGAADELRRMVMLSAAPQVVEDSSSGRVDWGAIG